MDTRRAVLPGLIILLLASAAACGDGSTTTTATRTPLPAGTATADASVATVTTIAPVASAESGTATIAAAVTPTPGASSTPSPTVTLPDAGTGIAGLVLIGPQCPVVREGEECPDKPLAATIEVHAGDRLVTTAMSGADGVFAIAVDPGVYRLVPLTPGGPVFAPEQTVEVRRGQTTRVLINYDSGIR